MDDCATESRVVGIKQEVRASGALACRVRSDMHGTKGQTGLPFRNQSHLISLAPLDELGEARALVRLARPECAFREEPIRCEDHAGFIDHRGKHAPSGKSLSKMPGQAPRGSREGIRRLRLREPPQQQVLERADAFDLHGRIALHSLHAGDAAGTVSKCHCLSQFQAVPGLAGRGEIEW